jgi:hypothetical protein
MRPRKINPTVPDPPRIDHCIDEAAVVARDADGAVAASDQGPRKRIVSALMRSRFRSMASGGKDLIGPAVIKALNGKVGPVRPVVPLVPHEALSERLEAFEPMSPLGLPFA